MGRLPDMYRRPGQPDRKILSRTPYIMAAAQNMRSSQTGIQFASAAFLHTNDKPFEIHRLLPEVFFVSINDPLNVVSKDNGALISCRVLDFGSNQEMLKASTPIPSIIKSTILDVPYDRTWEWTEPHTLEKTGGFTVTLDSAVFNDAEFMRRVTFAFQGFLLTLQGDR